MKIVRILLGVIASFALVNNVYAANKTHVTDTLGAGNSRVNVSYDFGGANLPGTVTLADGTSISVDGKISASRLAADFYLGVTDRLDVGIFLPFIENTKITQTLTDFGVTETLTYKNEGQGDIVISARYLILNKNQDKVSWNVIGTISPSTAPDNDAIPEDVFNGTVIDPGKTGDSGNGYMTTGVASTLSIPTGSGDVFLAANFYNYGDRTKAGVTYKKGSSTSFTVGIESMPGETITFRPYARLNFKAASTDSDGTNITASDGYDFGLIVTNDVSNNVSVQVGAEYNVINDVVLTSPTGDKFRLSGNGYNFNLSAMFFF